ncbi:MAG: sirohydrochlorin cobaltochelatase [Desulfovibrio sp.]|nr:sirohydrochlorin cobaltochelatase [Desulfovibrio sp.]
MKHAILLVAYGVANHSGRSVLAVFCARVRDLFPTCSVRWAYTSSLGRKRLAQAGIKSDSVAKALLRMRYEGFHTVIVQPLQTIAGREHNDLLATVADICAQTPMQVVVGSPLLTDQEDIDRVATCLVASLPREREPYEDVIFMGHGSKHPEAVRYQELDWAVQLRDKHVHVGTMEGGVTLEVLVPRLSSRRIWLLPLFSTVGRHTLQDMAGDAPTSWRSRLEALGHLCQVVLQGTIEDTSLAQVWLDHLVRAKRMINEVVRI